MPIIIRLQNLPMSANAANIRRFFSGLTIPEGGVHIVGGNDGDAFIAFSQEDDARKAMLLDNQSINGAPIRLFLSSKSEMKSVIETARNSALYGIPSQNQQSSSQAKAEDPLRPRPGQPSTTQQSGLTLSTPHLGFPNGSDGMQLQQQPLTSGFSTYQYGYGAPPQERMDAQSSKNALPSTLPSDSYASSQYGREGRDSQSFARSQMESADPRQHSRPTPSDQRSTPGGYNYQTPQTNYGYQNVTPSQSLNDYPSANKPPSQPTPSADPYWSQRDRPYQSPYQQPPPTGLPAYNYSDPYPHKHSSSQSQQPQQPPPQHYDYDRRSMSHGKTDDPFGSQSQTSPHPPSTPSVPPPVSQDSYPGYNTHMPPPHVEDPRRQSGPEEIAMYSGRPPPRTLPDQAPYGPSRVRMPTPLASGDQPYPRSTVDEHSYQLPRLGASEKYDKERESSRPFGGPQLPPRGPGNPERDFSIRPPWLDADEGRSGSVQRGKRPGEAPVPPGPGFFHDVHNDSQEDIVMKRRRGPPFSDEKSGDPPMQIPSGKVGCAETEFIARLSFDPADTAVRHVFDILRGVQIVPKYGIRIEEDSQRRSTGYVFVMLPSREMMDRALSCDKFRVKGRSVAVVASSLSDFYRVSDPTFTTKAPPELARKAVAASSRQPPPHHDDGCLELSNLPSDSDEEEISSFLGAPGLNASSVKLVPSSGHGNRTTRAYVRLPSVSDLRILMSAKPRPFRMNAASLGPVSLIPISRLQYDAYISSCESSSKDKDSHRRSHVDSSSKPPSDSSKPNQVIEKSIPKVCLCVQGFSRSVKVVDVLSLIKSVLIPGNGVHLIPPACTGALIDLISENNCIKAKKELDGDPDSGNGTATAAKQAHPDLRVEALTREQFEQRISEISNCNPISTSPEVAPGGGDAPSIPKTNLSKDEQHEQQSPEMRPGAGHPMDYPNEHGNRMGFGNRSGSRFTNSAPYFENQYRNSGPPFDPSRRGGRPPMPNYRGGMSHSGPSPGLGGPVLYLGNMPPGTTPEQVFELLSGYRFDRNSVRMKRAPNGQLTGDAMVAFDTPQETDRVLRELGGRTRFQGRMVMFQYEPF